MELKLIFLGTSGATPTKDRNLSGMVLNYQGNRLLFDCGEGSQRQMVRAKTSYMRINHIFLSHFHADHILGLPGLLATMAIHSRDYPLYIYGPRGIKELVQRCIELPRLKLDFEIICKEAREGVLVKEQEYQVSSVPVHHSAPCFAYVFEETGKEGTFVREKAVSLGIPVGPLFRQLQEGKSVKVKGKTIHPDQVMDYSQSRKGRKVAFVTDTLPGKGYGKAIKEADALVHEATFLEKDKDRARETFHCTALQAAKVAEKARVKALYLTHFSSRHSDPDKFEHEARSVFPNSIAARDLQVVSV